MNNIFHAFTRRCLKENKVRTLVTIIGIVLSMSLFTAVIEGGYSGVAFMQRSEVARGGAWNGCVIEASETTIEDVASQKRVKAVGTWSELGWAKIGSSNEYKPYLLIESMGEGFTDVVKINLTDGRMPENENEILLPDHLYRNGDLFIPSGTVMDLEIGKRTDLSGTVLPHSDQYMKEEEQLSDTFEKTYTVVGHYNRLSSELESYACPGYTALTLGAANGQTDLFFELKSPMGFNRFIDEMTEDGIINRSKLILHYDLLHAYGVAGSADISAVIGGFAAILIVLIFFGSVYLIYNSFSITVSERTKLYGILKSVGATKKQIRSTVRYEAALLAAIGIPIGLVVGCVGIGITLYALRDNFSYMLDTPADVKMKLVLNPLALLLAAVICFITTMVSANRPAGRAIRISPIDSVRQSEDVNIRAREVKTSKLTQKLFGFEGMLASKNFKRNRRRYRSVVLSLFMSVVLFISASSFCSYLTALVGDRSGYNLRSRMDIVYTYVEQDSVSVSADDTMRLLSGVPGVKSGMMLSQVYDYVGFRDELLSEDIDQPEIRQYFDSWVEVPGYKTMDTQIFIVDDRMFADYCSSAGADVKDFTDKNEPKALFINQRNFYLAKKTADVFGKDSRLPVSCSIMNVKDIEGYYFRGSEETEDGGIVYVYYPQEYMNDYWDGKIEQLDPQNALMLTPEEAVTTIDVTIGAFAGEDALDLFGPSGSIILPYSTAEAIFGTDKAKDYTSAKEMYFQVENHTAAFDAMKAILNEKGMSTDRLIDYAQDYEGMKMMVTVINVFAYGFIILISLIALANVFNTISTNIILRRREFAMLKSVGMDSRGFNKMMNYECIIYGVKGLSWGIPVSILTTYLIFLVARGGEEALRFFIPFGSFAVAIGSVFIVVFATMLFAMDKIKKDNPIDALKNENI